MYNRNNLMLHERHTARLRKEFRKELSVYWNNEYDNWVVHLNGKYLFEFKTGEPVIAWKVKRALHYVHSHTAQKDVVRETEIAREKKDEARMKGYEDIKHDFKGLARRFAIGQRKSVS